MEKTFLSSHIQARLDKFRDLGSLDSTLICLGREDCMVLDDEEKKAVIREVLDDYSKDIPVYLPESTAAGVDPVKRALKLSLIHI